MKLLTRQEYNLILRSLDYYDFLQLCYTNSTRFRNYGYSRKNKVYQITNKKTAEMPFLGNNN